MPAKHSIRHSLVLARNSTKIEPIDMRGGSTKFGYLFPFAELIATIMHGRNFKTYFDISHWIHARTDLKLAEVAAPYIIRARMFNVFELTFTSASSIVTKLSYSSRRVRKIRAHPLPCTA